MGDECKDTNRECPFDEMLMGRVVQKLDDIHDDVTGINKRLDIQNGRVRELEIGQSWHRGWIAGLGGVTIIVAIGTAIALFA